MMHIQHTTIRTARRTSPGRRGMLVLMLWTAAVLGTTVTAQTPPVAERPGPTIFADHFLDADPAPWRIVSGDGKTPAVEYCGADSDAAPGMHAAPFDGAVAWAPWAIDDRPFVFAADVEVTGGRAATWRLPGVAIAVSTSPPNEMGEDDIALSFALLKQGIQASVRRGGFFQPTEEGDHPYRSYRERTLDRRYEINMGGAGGHQYSAEYPRSRLAGLRLRVRIERSADDTIRFTAYLIDGVRALPWWEGEYALPDEYAGSKFRCVVVRGVLNPHDFKQLESGKFKPDRYGVRARFFAMQGRPLDGPPEPVVHSFRPDRLPLEPGGKVTVFGEHFDRGARVMIDGVAAKTTVHGVGKLEAELPMLPGRAPYSLAVVNATGLKGAYGHELFYGSVLDRVAPCEALPAGGDVVTVYGGGFGDRTRFTINGRPAEIVERLDACRVRIKVPPAEPGLAKVAARSDDASFAGEPTFGYSPHPYLWYKGAEGLADLRRKLDDPAFASYRKLFLARAALNLDAVEVRQFDEKVAELPAALRKPGGETGIAAQWFDKAYIDFNVKLVDGEARQVALYAFDYNLKGWPGPELKVEMRSPDSTQVLDCRTIQLTHSKGAYVVWTIREDVLIRVRGTNRYRAVAAGLFFDAPAADGDPSGRDKAVEFLKTDAKTAGRWRGTYGGAGYWIAGQPAKLPDDVHVKPRRFPARRVAHGAGSAPRIIAALWMYLLTEAPEQREHLMRLVDLEIGTDRWGNRPAECSGHPGRLLRRVDIDQFYFHTIAAVAEVYDTLFTELTADQRARIGRWLHDALQHYAGKVRGNDWWFAKNPSNTVAVGNSCGGIAALALRHSTPGSAELIDLAVKTIDDRFKAITPDGGCVEGPLYWNYALAYQMRFGQALRNVTGDDRGLLSSDRIRNSYRFVETMLGGDGTMFTFNDTNPMLTGAVIAASLDGADDSPRPELMRWLVDEIMTDRARTWPESGYATVRDDALVYSLLFRSGAKAPDTFPGVPTLTYLKTLQWGAMRSDGDSFMPNLVVGVKGRGGPTTHHAQDDLGSFVLYANGENYLIDPGYYETKADLHNALLIDGAGPQAKGQATIINAWETETRRSMAVDLQEAYRKKLPGLRRHIVMDGDRAVVLLDEVPEGIAKEATFLLQSLFEPQRDDGEAGLMLQGKKGRLRAECFGPQVKLKVRPRRWKQEWVQPRDHDKWYTVSGTYAPTSARPMVMIFAPVRGDGEPPQAGVRYTENAIQVFVDGRTAARFTRTADGWEAARP